MFAITIDKLLATLVLVTLANGSAAALIDYDENLSGDLNGTQDFLLDMVGSNVWSGSWTATRDPQGGFESDGDAFLFTIASGLQLESLIFETLNTTVSGYSNLSANLLLVDDGPPIDILYGEFQSVLNGIAFVSTNDLPGAANDYRSSFGFTGFGCATNTACSATATYRLTLQTAAVPGPGTLALLGIGLAGLGWKRRKQA